MEHTGFDQGLQGVHRPQQPPPASSRHGYERGWFWIVMGILCWKGFWLIMADHADDDNNRYIVITYVMLYITYMALVEFGCV